MAIISVIRPAGSTKREVDLGAGTYVYSQVLLKWDFITSSLQMGLSIDLITALTSRSAPLLAHP
jgi:hypothetical protein